MKNQQTHMQYCTSNQEAHQFHTMSAKFLLLMLSHNSKTMNFKGLQKEFKYYTYASLVDQVGKTLSWLP